MAKKATRGNNAQFTYDFGIAIAQSTVNKITRLTGATLTLASAYYALKTTATQYVDTLRENTLRFGGMLSTMKAMEDAQRRLIKGQSYFAPDDQLRGMNQLMAVGVKVGENLEWINKAAHATGRSFSDFSGMIASAIQGNSQALVDAGLMTQRATRMFDKYAANTIMRQQAILNFVKNHKGLMNVIKNDFETIQDQMTRIKGIWSAFLKSVVGKPNDPQSFYGQIVASMKMVAVALAQNAEKMQKYGFMIGQTLGWVIRQIGHFVVWVGRQVKKALESVWKVTDDFQSQTRSLLVWLEFWKLKVLDFFKEYGGAIKTVLKLLIAYKVLKLAFVVGKAAIASVIALKNAWLGALALQKRYIAFMGPAVGNKFTRWLQSLAVFMPKALRHIWVYLGRVVGLVRFLSLANPFGWVALAITAFVTLYTKCKEYRILINKLFGFIIENSKLIWNSAMYLITWVMVGVKKLWGYIKEFFAWTWDGIKSLWAAFKDSSVGKFLDKWVIKPLKSAFDWILMAWDKVVKGLSKALEWLGIANNSVSSATQDLAAKYGVPTLPTFGGGTYAAEDDTNYLNPFRNSGNPLSPEPVLAQSAPTSSSMNFSNGAIQIIVQKGENIDENKLARKVREVIKDFTRENNMRGGTA